MVQQSDEKTTRQQARKDRETYLLTHNIFGVQNVLGDLLPGLLEDLDRLYTQYEAHKKQQAANGSGQGGEPVALVE